MYEQQLSNLIEWIESKNKNGFYVDNAIHPIWGTLNTLELPHTFHYYGIILGYLELFKKFGKKEFFDHAVEASDSLCKLQKPSGQYRFDNFQDNVFDTYGLTPIHNALPSIALLHMYIATNNKRYLRAAKKNIKWIFSRMWNNSFISGVVNQDMCVAEAVATLYSIEKNPIYKYRAKRIADYCSKYQVKSGKFEGSFKRGKNAEDLIIPWYNSKSAYSFLQISKLLNEKKYEKVAFDAAKFIAKNISSKGLKRMYVIDQKIPEITLVSPIGLPFLLLKEFNIKASHNVLNSQEKDGSYLSAIGYDDSRDTIPTLAWNSFMFLYLVNVASNSLPKPKVSKVHRDGKVKTLNVGFVRSPSKNGIVLFMKGFQTVYTSQVVDRKFKYPDLSGYYSVKVIMDRCLPKSVVFELPSKISVTVLHKSIFLPLITFRALKVWFLNLFFESRIYDRLCRILR